MKMPGKELGIVIVGLLALAVGWTLVFMATRERWRPGAAAAPAPAADSAAEPASTDAEAAPEGESSPAR